MKSTLSRIFSKIKNTPKSELLLKIKLGLKTRLFASPATILIQTTAACNLKCKHCFINYYNNVILDGKIKLLNFNEFKEIADKISPSIKLASFLQFSSFEPLLNKDLFKMMDYVLTINPKLQFYIHSNGMLMNEKNISELEKRPIFAITLSLDGITKDTVEQFKTGVDFTQIISNFKLLAKSKLQNKTSIVFVLHKNNKDELLDFPNFVKDIGFKNIHINNLMAFLPEFENQVLFSQEGNNEIEKLFDELTNRIKKNKQTLQIPNTKPKNIGCTQCNILYIDVNGNVSPCDYLAVSTPFTLFGKTQQLAPIIFGNIFETSIKKIYNSTEYKNFRNNHFKGIIPEHCKLCINSYNLLCSNRKTIE